MTAIRYYIKSCIKCKLYAFTHLIECISNRTTSFAYHPLQINLKFDSQIKFKLLQQRELLYRLGKRAFLTRWHASQTHNIFWSFELDRHQRKLLFCLILEHSESCLCHWKSCRLLMNWRVCRTNIRALLAHSLILRSWDKPRWHVP